MTTSSPLVSVVIPAFNAQTYLADCLASVQAQRGEFGMEVFVVDDGSTDGTAGIAQRHPGVTLLRQPNRGPSAARNAGIEAAGGEFVAFLDADDLWPEGKLAAQLAVLQRHPEAGLVFGDCQQFNAERRWPQTEFEAAHLGGAAWGNDETVPDAYPRLLTNNFITTGSVVVRRSVLAGVGGFAEDLRLVEDLDLWLRIALRHRIAWSSHLCLLRRRHAANTSCDAEAMGLAYLNVLGRQPSSDDLPRGMPNPELKLHAAREYMSLSELALGRGDMRTAWQRAWRGVATRGTLHGAWQLGRASMMLLGSAVRSPGRKP